MRRVLFVLAVGVLALPACRKKEPIVTLVTPTYSHNVVTSITACTSVENAKNLTRETLALLKAAHEAENLDPKHGTDAFEDAGEALERKYKFHCEEMTENGSKSGKEAAEFLERNRADIVAEYVVPRSSGQPPEITRVFKLPKPLVTFGIDDGDGGVRFFEGVILRLHMWRECSPDICQGT